MTVGRKDSVRGRDGEMVLEGVRVEVLERVTLAVRVDVRDSDIVGVIEALSDLEGVMEDEKEREGVGDGVTDGVRVEETIW